MNDPVLQRSMFRGPQPTVAPGAPAGIRSMTTPDENAQALRNMFRTPAAMVQPVQSFQQGGLAERLEITPPPILAEDPVSAVAPAAARSTAAAPELDGALSDLFRGSRGNALLSLGRMDLSGIGSLLEGARDAFLRSRGVARGGADQRVVLPKEGPVPPPRPEMPGEVRPLEAPREVGPAPGTGLPAEPPRTEGIASIKTNLSEIREDRLSRERANLEAERRQRTAADRRENALLALLQAGLATAAGTSRNAITNIGAGGQAGVAAFAGMERARREDEASRRREETSLMLAREQLRAQEERAPEQIRTLAMLGGWTPDQGREGLNAAVTRGLQVQKSMEKEPDTMRLIRALGNGDLARGFEIYKADESLRAAQVTVANLTAPEEVRRNAQAYLDARIRQSLQTIQGGQTPPPGSTVIPWNQLPVR